jgi:hypothetical protein
MRFSGNFGRRFAEDLVEDPQKQARKRPMPNDFESTPYDGHHSPTSPGNDWRNKGGIGGFFDRFVSYGNWAGPGNRMDTENADYIARQHAQNPNYDKYNDPTLMNNPRYQPIDGIDAGARTHDHGYSQHLGGANMFGWQGMHNVRDDDRRLVADVQAEMDANGGKYSPGAQMYSKGLRGFFGGRVMGQDAVDWAGNKAHEAGAGISNFVHGAQNWHSLGDAGRGIAQGISGAGSWLANTGREAIGGISSAARTAAQLGPVGMLSTGLGLANVAGAGVANLVGKAWNGASSVGHNIASGASNLAHSAGSAISSGVSSVAGAARKGASKLFGWLGG